MKLSQIEWGPVGKAALKEYGKDDIAGLAAEMAYWIIFSLFPFFIFMATLAGIIQRFTGKNVYADVTTNLYNVLEESTARTLQGVLDQVVSPEGGALSFGALFSAALALNSASSAIDTTMKAFNRAYGVEETRNFVVKKLTSLGLTLALILLIIGGALLLAIGGDLIERLGLGSIATIVLSGVRVVGALAAIMLGLAILYWKGPNIKQQFQWISPGSVIATVVLVAFVGLFSLYVRLFAGSGVNKTYGTLAGLILFLMFLRWASTIILLGAEFNSEAAMRYDPELIRDKVINDEKVLPGEQPHPHPQAAREAGVSAQRAATAGKGTANGKADHYAPEAFEDPQAAERLRALRERPMASELTRVRNERAQQTATDKASAGKSVLVALGASIAAALLGAISGAKKRET